MTIINCYAVHSVDCYYYEIVTLSNNHTYVCTFYK